MIALQNGINLGGWLSQCNYTKERYETFITEKDFQQIAQWKFDHVRVPFDFNVIEDANGNDLPENWKYLDNAVNWGKISGLNVILDLHKTAGFDFNDFGDNEKNNLFANEILQKRFLALWDRVSKRYAHAENVAFELLNEVTDLEFRKPWNDLIQKAVEVIRKNAPETPIIYGGVCWNSACFVKDLLPPTTKNIIYTFHLYEPLLFTHQKASWVPALKNQPAIPFTDDLQFFRENSRPLGYMGENILKANCKKMGTEFFEAFLTEAVSVAKKNGVPLYCGEFGVIDQADANETVKWFDAVLQTFDKFGIGHSLWSYKEMDFGFIDPHYEPLRNFLLSKV